MKHAITFGDLLLTLGVVGGIVGILFGGLMFFAGASSDAPDVSEEYGRKGCVVAIFGLILFVGSLWRALS